MSKIIQDPEIRNRFLLGLELYESAVDQERLRALREDPFITKEEFDEHLRRWHQRSLGPGLPEGPLQGSPKSFYGTLAELANDLRDLHVDWAVIGGLAFLIRVDARHTRDIDLSISVANQRASESLVRDLAARGYRLVPGKDNIFDNVDMDRTSTVRLRPPGATTGVVVDLLFASSGIEREIVLAAEEIEVTEGLTLPVALKEHLLALKILAGRPKDQTDAAQLVRVMSTAELEGAREALDLINRRGFSRKKNLQEDLTRLIADQP